MSPILYRLRRSLRHHLGTTALLALVVAIMLGLALTLVAGASRTLSAPDRYARAFGGGYDVQIDQSDAEPSPEALAALPGVQKLSSATFVFGFLTADGQEVLGDAIVFTGSVDAVAGSNLVAGREPRPGRTDEIIVSSSFLAQTGTQLGDRFDLSTFTQEQADASSFDNPVPEGPTTTAQVVGVFGGASELADGYVIALFSPALLDLGDVGLGGGTSSVQLVPGTTLDDLRRQLDTLPNGTDLSISEVDWVPPAVRSAVRTQGQGLGILALFAVVAAVATIGQLLGRQYRMSEAERLALQSLGMTRRQLLIDPVARAAAPIVVGAIGAAVIAIACSRFFPTGFVKQIEPDPGLRFDLLVHTAGPLVLILSLLAWVAVGLAFTERRRPVNATTPFVDGIASRLQHAEFATGLRFAFSAARDRRWPAGSFFGLAIVLAVVIGALTLGANLTQLVDQPSTWGSPPLTIGTGGDGVPDDAREVLATDPDVAAVTYYGAVTVAVGVDGLDVAGIQPTRGELLPPLLSGRLPQSDDEVVLGKVAARALNVGIGDEFEVRSETGPHRLRVTGLAVIPSVERGDGIGEGGVVTIGGLHQLDPMAPLSLAGLELRPGAPAGTAERLSSLTGLQIGPAQATTQIVNLDRIRSIPLLVAAVLAAFAVLSLTHQLVVSARQRRRDLGILKALGANRGFVSQVVHVQATVFTVATIVLAVPIGVVVGQSVYRFITDSIGAQSDATVPVGALAVAILVPLVVANLVAVLPARRARRLRPALHLTQE
jgi:ABC-type lipoprotein release transport system permease subunit